ncbi:UbiA prenyltransferase family-domain-containing protein [Truncatella angustata]|uniref:UbiA prenyltransferase family-domain-containing protein n=1 Tax=Truncatella angustata TaxID=152316 RepID=A0A9P8RJX0_9PEZI|nr:UbiA prenyltransferase family-domain-containing protein [Truncatella angustata]KAH6639971.1 UbiA prenyltransferase family-domain-containing protein [Truncatella angustata]
MMGLKLIRLDQHLYTLYLVTASDFVAVLIPQTLFASFSVLSGQFTNRNVQLSPAALLSRLPYILLWIWLQLLVLDLANQRLPESVTEDTLNKPWRPIPSGRLTPSGARDLLVFSIALTLVLSSMQLGGASETLLLFTLNWVYNDIGLANSHWALRNLMNALGITTIGAGAISVAFKGYEYDISVDRTAMYRWLFLCAAVLMSTVQAQDLYDQEGDSVRGRSTAPLVLGDCTARWSVAIPVLFWSIAIPAFMGLGLFEHMYGYATPVLMGIIVATRILTRRTVVDDKTSFKAWAVWTICLYMSPLLKVIL